MDTGLSQRQKLFAFFYFQGRSLKDAILESGYKCKPDSAYVMGSRLIRKVKIQTEIESLNATYNIGPSRLISNLVRVLNDKNAKVTTSGRIKLLELAMKLQGMHPDQLYPSGKKKSNEPVLKKNIGVDFRKIQFTKITPSAMPTIQLEDAKSEPVEPGREDTPVASSPSNHESRNISLIKKAVPKPVPRAVPMTIPRAIPRKSELKQPIPAYSLTNFRNGEVDNHRAIYYPA